MSRSFVFCEPFVVSTAAVSGGVTGQVQHGRASSPQRMLVSGGLARANQEDGNSGGAGRAGRQADQMVTQRLTQAFVC